MKWTFPNLRLFLALAVITGGIYPRLSHSSAWPYSPTRRMAP